MDDLILLIIGGFAGYLIFSLQQQNSVKFTVQCAEKALNECIKDGSLPYSVAQKIFQKWVEHIEKD